MAETFFLGIIAFCSSALTAVVGLGGGLLLISVMPLVLPATAVIPVHGVVQLCSNASRGLFGRRDVVWSLLPSFITGVILGCLLGSRVVLSIPPDYLPIPLAGFILLMTWLPQLKENLRLPGKFLSLGIVQGFLTLLVGASCPLNMPVLLRHGLAGSQAIATQGLLMSVVHLSKVIVFGSMGFSFARYLPLMLFMVVAATAGSWLGTRLRHRAPDELLKKILKGLVTVLALRMIWVAW